LKASIATYASDQLSTVKTKRGQASTPKS